MSSRCLNETPVRRILLAIIVRLADFWTAAVEEEGGRR